MTGGDSNGLSVIDGKKWMAVLSMMEQILMVS